MINKISFENINHLAEQILLYRRKGVTTPVKSMVHDTNNSLSLILMAAEEMQDLLEEESIDKQALLDEVNQVLKTIQRIGVDLKAFTNIYSSPKPSSENSIISLELLTADLTKVLQTRLKRSGVNLVWSEIPEVNLNGPKSDVYNLFFQLLDNSLDAIEGTEYEKTIHCNFHIQDERLVFNIQDNGHGIDPKDNDILFQAFTTTKESSMSMGLGLWSCNKIVENLKGSIEIESFSKPTCIKVTLPFTQ